MAGWPGVRRDFDRAFRLATAPFIIIITGIIIISISVMAIFNALKPPAEVALSKYG